MKLLTLYFVILITEIMGVLNLIHKLFTIGHQQQCLFLCGSQRRHLGVGVCHGLDFCSNIFVVFLIFVLYAVDVCCCCCCCWNQNLCLCWYLIDDVCFVCYFST